MKTRLFTAIVAAVLISPIAAAAQGYEDALKGLYFDIRGGASLVPDADNSGAGITSNIVIESQFDPGFVIDAAVGYEHPSGLRGELALGYRLHDVDTLTITNDGGVGVFLGVGSLNGLGATADGDVQTISIMANGFYDFDFDSKFKPFVGAGLGAAFIGADVSVGGVNIVDDNDEVFAYQGMLGISYAFSGEVTASLLYSYFATTDPEFTDAAGGSFDSEYSSHNVMVGLRFTR